jgi:hypothetical protein
MGYSYLGGGAVVLLHHFRSEGGLYDTSSGMNLDIVNVTLAGTPIVPSPSWRKPYNVDLITVGPGVDLTFRTADDTRETISGHPFARCNGLADGVDGPDSRNRWLALDFDSGKDWAVDYPYAPNFRTNHASWDLLLSQSRSVRGIVGDVLIKEPGAYHYLTLRDLEFFGRIFPLGEVEAPGFSRDLPDIQAPSDFCAQFPTKAACDDQPTCVFHANPSRCDPRLLLSGAGLGTYLKNVVLPIAKGRKDDLLGLLVGRSDVKTLLGNVSADLHFVLVGGGKIGTYDICLEDVAETDCVQQ